MSQITKPLALDETLQQVAEKIDNIPSVSGKSAYQYAQDNGFIGSENEFNTTVAKTPLVIRPNLLDNWYFVGGGSPKEAGHFPIYQDWGYVAPPGINYYSDTSLTTNVGTLTEYYDAGWGGSPYCSVLVDNTTYYVAREDCMYGNVNEYSANTWYIDRWKSRKSSIIVIYPDCVRITHNASSPDQRNFSQGFPYEQFAGKELTLSMLIKDTLTSSSSYPKCGFYTANSVEYNTQNLGTITIPNKGNGLYTVTTTIPQSSEYPYLNITIGYDSIANSSGYLDIIAAKLEYGSEQSLAHQENGEWVLNEIPNYTEELWKCQKYSQIFSNSDIRPTKKNDCRPVMRVDPSTRSCTLDGESYYRLDANL